MGANPVTSRGDKTFFTVSNGNFAVRVPEGTENAVKRVIINKQDKSEKIVWELLYKDIDANISSIEIDEASKFGDQLKINLVDAMDSMTVILSMDSREAKSFLCRLKNIDLSKQVTLSPFNFADKSTGKKIIGLNVYQGEKKDGKHPAENKVVPYFSKETPNGFPQADENMDKDEFKLLLKQQEIFLKKWLKKWTEEKAQNKPIEKLPKNTADDFDEELGF